MHSIGSPGLHERGHLMPLAFPDQVHHRIRSRQHLRRRNPAPAVRRGNQALGHNPLQYAAFAALLVSGLV